MAAALVALVVIGAGGAVAHALRLPPAGGVLPGWAGLLGPYLALGAISSWRLSRRGELRDLLRLRAGDLSLGILLALLLVAATWLVGTVWLPATSPRHAWLLRVSLLAGDASSAATIGALLVLAACEELVWRGLVQSELCERLGPRRGWLAGAAAYAAAYTPTLITLRDDAAGPNPLLVVLALGAGLCWGLLRARSGRVAPAMLSHAAFAYLASPYLGRIL